MVPSSSLENENDGETTQSGNKNKNKSHAGLELTRMDRIELSDEEEENDVEDDDHQDQTTTATNINRLDHHHHDSQRQRHQSNLSNQHRSHSPPLQAHEDGNSNNTSRVSTFSETEKDPDLRTRKEKFNDLGIAIWTWLGEHTNFYRVHLMVFTFVPLIASSIFYGIDTRDNSYINCLTVCTSALTVTGLNPVLMENISRGQQAILFILMLSGNIVAVSIVTIIIRRHFFKKRFEHMIKTDPRARRRVRDIEVAEEEKHRLAHPNNDPSHHNHHLHIPSRFHRFHFGNGNGENGGVEAGVGDTSRTSTFFNGTGNGNSSRSGTPNGSNNNKHHGNYNNQQQNKPKKRKRDRLRVDMIRRVDEPVRVNQMNVGGFLSENGGIHPRGSIDSNGGGKDDQTHFVQSSSRNNNNNNKNDDPNEDDNDGAGGNEGLPLSKRQNSSRSATSLQGSQDGILERTATRTDSPMAMSPVPINIIEETPSSPRRTRRVSLAMEQTNSIDRQSLSTGPLMKTIVEGAPMSRIHSVASSVFVDDTSSTSSIHQVHNDNGAGTDKLEGGHLVVNKNSDGGSSSKDDATPISATETSVPASASASTFPSRSRRMSDPAIIGRAPPPPHLDLQREFKRVRTMDPPRPAATSPATGTFPRTQTIEIREPKHPDRPRGYSSALPHVGAMHGLSGDARRRAPTASSSGAPLERTQARRGSMEPMPRTMTRGTTAMSTGFGGFPNPVKYVANAATKRLLPKTGTLDLPRTTTLQSVHSIGGLSNFAGGPTKAVSYISFDAVVGRNSRFYSLTSAQRDELGGIEYRSLSLLLKLVIAYFVLVQLILMIILSPIMQSRHYDWLFAQDQGTVTGAGGWYVVFNVASAFSNAGLSLLDESMTPFQRSYAYVLCMGFCIVAGNTAYPIFLRFGIWSLSKLTRKQTRLNETLQFLLDHPRRCFIYLFPSHQTWLLVLMLVFLNSTDWICFIVLDIGGEVLKVLPPAAKAIDGLFQAFAVRAAGFSIVALSQTAPALQFLYVIMMYLSVFPLAMSIRSTNVYEEKSMGLYDEHDDTSEIEAEFQKNKSVGSYFAHHARKQLAFDIWWLGLALWVICIVERSNIADPATDTFFNIFTIIFEVVSAYGTVGLSLGTPTANYSLCGDFRTISKLVLCAVMIRGRHRGLPVAIDRSILLPSDLEALHGLSNDRTQSISVSQTLKNTFSIGGLGEKLPRMDTLRRARTRTFSRGYTGGEKPEPMQSGRSNISRPSRLREETGPTSPVIQFAPAPQVPKREGGLRPTLNGYLSTIYSENPSPAETPDPDRHSSGMVDGDSTIQDGNEIGESKDKTS